LIFPFWKNIIIPEWKKKGGDEMEIFTVKQQRKLLTVKGLNHLTRDNLAKEIGVSLPTMSKLINDSTPLAVQNSIYQRVNHWLNNVETVTDE
jgi:DNA-binding XRE family transcriptional regulator